MSPPKLIATCALAVLVASVALLVMGFNEAQRDGEERNGLRTIPSDSEFVRSLLDARLADDLGEVNETVWLLRAANRLDDAEGLSQFFIHCNVQRVLAQDDACRSETVRSAIAKGRSLRISSADRSSAPENLAPMLARALSFRLPDEQTLLGMLENSRRNVRYDGPGVLRYRDPDGGYLFVAATNETAWTIAKFEARLTVVPPGAPAIELDCSNDNPFPFSDGVVEPTREVPAYCRPPSDIRFEQVVTAIREMQASDVVVGMAVVRLDFRNPYVRVIDRGERTVPRFLLEPIVWLFSEGRDFDITMREAQLPRELAAIDCEELGTCRSAVPSFVLRVLDEHVHPLTLPPFFGALLGAIIGGFARRRSLKFGGAFIALLMTAAAIGIGGLVGIGGGETGFVLMGAATLAAGAVVIFVLGVPAFFIALALVRALHPKPSSA